MDSWSAVNRLNTALSSESDPFEALARVLAAEGYESVWAFDDQLASALKAVDTPQFEQAAIDLATDDAYDGKWTPPAIDALRCAIVRAGKDTYDRIASDFTQVAGPWNLGHADALTSVAVRASAILDEAGENPPAPSPPATSAALMREPASVEVHLGFAEGASVGGNLVVGDEQFETLLESRLSGLLFADEWVSVTEQLR
jgi:hypothetical protein